MGKPIVILADTVKGKGVSFMEDIAGWHGKRRVDETGERRWPSWALTTVYLSDSSTRAKHYQGKWSRSSSAQDAALQRDYWWNAITR